MTRDNIKRALIRQPVPSLPLLLDSLSRIPNDMATGNKPCWPTGIDNARTANSERLLNHFCRVYTPMRGPSRG